MRSKMVIISECLYSSKSSEEIVKRTSKITPPPEFLSINGPYARYISKYRIKSITIFQFDESKLLQALDYIGQRLSSCDGVSSFSYNVRIWDDEKKLAGLWNQRSRHLMGGCWIRPLAMVAVCMDIFFQRQYILASFLSYEMALFRFFNNTNANPPDFIIVKIFGCRSILYNIYRSCLFHIGVTARLRLALFYTIHPVLICTIQL